MFLVFLSVKKVKARKKAKLLLAYTREALMREPRKNSALCTYNSQLHSGMEPYLNIYMELDSLSVFDMVHVCL